MKKTILLFLVPFLGFAQVYDNQYKSASQIEINPFSLGAGYNFLVGENSFIKTQIGIAGGTNVHTSISYSLIFSDINPFVLVGYDLFYNKNRRIKNKKSLENNSGNYFGTQLKYYFGKEDNSDVNKTLLTEVHWGIQRSLGGHFYFNTHIGLGYMRDFDYKEGIMTPTFGLKFGYLFF